MDESSGRISGLAPERGGGGMRAAKAEPPVRFNHHVRLKQETAELHEMVEKAVNRLNPFASVQRYRRFILNNLAFYRALEGWAEACGVRSLLDDWPERRKQDLLIADAQALAAFPDEVPETPLGMMPAAPANPAVLLGALYVTEGATLGAAILATRARRIGFAADWGARFFHANGAARRHHWQTFLQVLNAAPFEPQDIDASLRSALHTFESYRDHVILR